MLLVTNINRGNQKYLKPGRVIKISDFRIFNIYMDFFIDFTESIQDFRVVGDSLFLIHML